MRSGFVCVLAVAGCNSIFGSHDVVNGSKDADTRPKDAAPYTMYLTGMAYDTTTQPMLTPDSGAATFPVLVNATVAVGKLGETPHPIALDATGAFTVPYDLAQGVYRIVYTPPDGVPVEIQGKLQSAHFVVPTLGRPDAMPAPADAVLGELLPMTGPNPYVNLHLFAIGTFAVRIVGMRPALGSTTTWTTNAVPPDAIQSMSGPLETPEQAKGDRLVVIDGAIGDADTATGFSIGTIPDFSATYVSPTLTPWKTTTNVGSQSLKWGYAASQLDTSMRLTAAMSTGWANDIDDGNGLGYVPPFVYGGLVPTTKLPNFVEAGAGYAASSNHWAARGYGGLGMPIYLPLSKATVSTVSMVHVFNGTDAPAFPTAMFVRYSRSKVVEGVTLTGGIQTIALADNTATTNVPVSVGLASTPAQHMTLNGADITVDSGLAFNVPSTPEMDLVFNVDKPATTDDCISTIYAIDTSHSVLVPVHRFISTPNNVQVNSTIQVDGSIFTAGQDYLIGISCHAGLPGVATALDWTQVTYPFSESVIWSYPFTVQ
ncbi:MAG: hypothetical protein ABI467_15520 [Kofleriaceae bacterium]